MPVGKGSLKRAVSAKPQGKGEIISLADNNIVELEVNSLKFKKVKDNAVMLASVKSFGVLLPVVVVKDGEELKVIDGAKRLSALSEIGVKTVKAVIVDADGRKLSAELGKFKQTREQKDDIHEQKFNVVKRLGEDDLPIYLL